MSQNSIIVTCNARGEDGPSQAYASGKRCESSRSLKQAKSDEASSC